MTATPEPAGPWVIVGLGNPGPRYAGNRHNLGAMVVTELASRCRVKFGTHKTRTVLAQARIGSQPGPSGVGVPVTLAIPSTYMNESGGPVKAVLAYLKVAPDHLVVVHDELDVDAGRVRLKFGGGEGGHNGLRSVSTVLGTRDYFRVRVGVGRPPGRMDAADYVLRDFGSVERRDLDLRVADGADATEALITMGLAPAQQRFHSPD